jgi:hypothetical protein
MSRFQAGVVGGVVIVTSVNVVTGLSRLVNFLVSRDSFVESAVDGKLALVEAIMEGLTFGRVELVPNIAFEGLVTESRVVLGVEHARGRFVGRITRRMRVRKMVERRHRGRFEGCRVLRLGRLGLLLSTMSVDGWKSRLRTGNVDSRMFRETVGMSIETSVVESRVETGLGKIGNVHGWILLVAKGARARAKHIRGGTSGGRSYHNRIWLVTEILRLAVVVRKGLKVVRVMKLHLHVAGSYGGRLIRSIDGRE